MLYLEQPIKAKFLFNIYLVLVLKAIPFQHESPTFLYLIYLQGDFWEKHAFFPLLICLVSFCFKLFYQWFKQNDSFTLKTTGQKGESAVYWAIMRAEAVS